MLVARVGGRRPYLVSLEDHVQWRHSNSWRLGQSDDGAECSASYVSNYGTAGNKKSGETAVKSWREKIEGVLWSMEESEVKVRHLK